MHTLFFHQGTKDERLAAVAELTGRDDAAVIIVTTSAGTEAAAPLPTAGFPEKVSTLAVESEHVIDSFNPVDLLANLTSMDAQAVVMALCDPLIPEQVLSFGGASPLNVQADPGWHRLAADLLRAVVGDRILRVKSDAALVEGLNIFFTDDTVYNLALILDKESKLMVPTYRAIIAGFLQKEEVTRSAILTILHGYLTFLNHASTQRLLERTTFDLPGLIGAGGTVVVQVSPHLWYSHAGLIRLWLAAFFLVAETRAKQGRRTLVAVEDVSPLKLFPQLLSAQRRFAGLVEISTFWESVSQLRCGYPADWTAFVGGCGGVEALGPQSPLIAKELGEAFGAQALALRTLSPGCRLPLDGAGEPTAPARTLVTGQTAGSGHRVIFASAHAPKWEQFAETMRKPAPDLTVVFESAGRCHELAAIGNHSPRQVVRLDPFGVTGKTSDCFNPLDLLSRNLPGVRCDAFQMAEILSACGTKSHNPFWEYSVVSLLGGVLQYLLSTDAKPKNLGELWRIFYSDDPVYNLAVVLDNEGKKLPVESYRAISACLQLNENIRARAIAQASKDLGVFGRPATQQIFDKTSFDLDGLITGGGTVFLEMPTQHWTSHGVVMRLWLAAFLILAEARTRRGQNTRIIVEHAGPWKMFTQLLAAQRTAGTRVEICSFWESPGQFQVEHPADWLAFLGTCSSVEILEPQSAALAAELESVFGEDRDHASNLSARGIPPFVHRTGLGHPSPKQSAGHRVLFAPAQADKWTKVAATIADANEGLTIVLETAGRCHDLTAGRAAARGPVLKLDPFSILPGPTDHFNPLDLMKSPALSCSLADLLAGLIYPPDSALIDPFWRGTTVSLLQGIMGAYGAMADRPFSFPALRELLENNDVVYNLAVLLDTEKKRLPTDSYQLLAQFLSQAEISRQCILASAMLYSRVFAYPSVAAAMEKTSFDLDGLVSGAPAVVYIEIPLMRLPAAELVASVWMNTFIHWLGSLRLPHRPRFVVDSAFVQTLFPTLRQAQAGSWAEVWTYWETLDQMRVSFPEDWMSFLANAGEVCAIGPQPALQIQTMAAIFQRPTANISSLLPGQWEVLQASGHGK